MVMARAAKWLHERVPAKLVSACPSSSFISPAMWLVPLRCVRAKRGPRRPVLDACESADIGRLRPFDLGGWVRENGYKINRYVKHHSRH